RGSLDERPCPFMESGPFFAIRFFSAASRTDHNLFSHFKTAGTSGQLENVRLCFHARANEQTALTVNGANADCFTIMSPNPPSYEGRPENTSLPLSVK